MVRIVLSLEPGIALSPSIKTALDCLRMSLERCLTPSEVAIRIRDLDEQPSRRHSEVFDLRDFAHD